MPTTASAPLSAIRALLIYNLWSARGYSLVAGSSPPHNLVDPSCSRLAYDRKKKNTGVRAVLSGRDGGLLAPLTRLILVNAFQKGLRSHGRPEFAASIGVKCGCTTSHIFVGEFDDLCSAAF